VADLIARVAMTGAGIVEAHGLIDEAEPKYPRIRVEIARGLAKNRRDVVHATSTVGEL
jgi:hypothetical protein